ncbi:MAG: flagellin lysine-N-methylase [Clostridia bacterium]|nr:flagellin lysine-N-methylase [Clostridia bacterium]
MRNVKLLAPSYYQKFHCIADRCRHNCCIGWEIDIDDRALTAYGALQGEIGKKICQSIEWGADGAHFRLQPNGRCTQLSDRGLCRIITALGEGYLCEICREHPRFYHTVGDTLEVGLGAACEEAARLILAEADYATLLPVGEAEVNAAAPAAFDVAARRAALFSVLGDPTLPYEVRREAVNRDFGLGAQPTPQAVCELFASLEYLEVAHRDLFLRALGEASPADRVSADARERFLAYLVYRHASPSQTLREFRTAVSLALLLEQLFARLVACCGLDAVEAARIISEELEYSEENTEAIRFTLELGAFPT